MKRLDLSNADQLVNRREVKQILELCDQVGMTTKTTGVVLHGDPGSGKTVIIDQVYSTLPNVSIRGKYEELAAASEPFAALRQAIDELVRQLSQERQNWKLRLCGALDKDADILIDVFPSLKFLLMDDNTEDEQEDQKIDDTSSSESSIHRITFDAFGNAADKEWRFERLRMALRALLRCVSSHRSIVMILDDIQWADPDSLAIIKTLIEDTAEPRRFFFVGASRPPDQHMYLTRFLSEASREKLSMIHITQLSNSDITKFLAKLLDRSDEETRELATVIREKTGGNAFIVSQFLRLLEQKKYIYFSTVSCRWEWENDQIVSAAMSDNVIQLVSENLKTVDEKTRSALLVAASFGVSYFAVATIVHAIPVLENYKTTFDDMASNDGDAPDPHVVREGIKVMEEKLAKAAQEGFVQRLSPGLYKFSHDRIREAAYGLLPDGTARKKLHLRIGRQLRSWMDMQAELGVATDLSSEMLLLHATKQLNAASDVIQDVWERVDLAELNLQSAELAARKTSFSQAMEYLKTGLEHLGENRWNDHYELTLKLSVALTRIQCCLGMLEDSIRTGDEVISNAKHFSDKRPVFHTKLVVLCQQERLDDALHLVLSVFDMLGKSFPKRSVGVRASIRFYRKRNIMVGMSDEEILNIKHIEDEKLCDESDFSMWLGDLSLYDAQYWPYALFATLFMVEAMVENNRSPIAGFAVAAWAWFQIQLGSIEEGVRFARLSLKLAERFRHLNLCLYVRTVNMYWTMLYHWERPIRDALEPLARGFCELWKHGFLDYFYMDKVYHLHIIFASGEPLYLVIQECSKLDESFTDYKQMNHWYSNAPLHQAVLNFMIISENQTVLAGEHMDENVHRNEWLKCNNKVAEFQYQLFTMILSYHFGDYRRAKRFCKMLRKDLWAEGPDILVPIRVLYTGLIYSALYRTKRKAKYKRYFVLAKDQIRQWAEKGAVNCIYMQKLLEAEMAFSDNEDYVDEIQDKYDCAIKEVNKLGLVHHVALANELAGAFLIQRKLNRRASHYIRTAQDCYRKWGAAAKVQQLQQIHGTALHSNMPSKSKTKRGGRKGKSVEFDLSEPSAVESRTSKCSIDFQT